MAISIVVIKVFKLIINSNFVRVNKNTIRPKGIVTFGYNVDIRLHYFD